MTTVTLGTGLDMGNGFSSSGRSIVALGAATRCHVIMVKNRSRPAIGGVAVIASVTRTDMVRCFAGGGRAIVAG